MKNQASSFPPFPTEVIKGLARDFVDLYKGKREVPDELLWASFATYFGNLVSPYARLRDFEASEPRLYTVNIGRSGRSKKSTAQNLARDFVRRLNAEAENKIRIIEGFGSAEGLVSQLQPLGSAQPAMLHLDEINVLAQKTGIDGSVGIHLLNKLFEDHQYEHPIRDKNPKIANAHLSLIGASTSEDYQKAWSGKHKDTGFFSRLFVVPAEPTALRVPLPQAPDQQSYNALQERVGQVLTNVQAHPQALAIDDDALKLWWKFYDTIGDGEAWNRIDAYGFRLMTLQAVLTGQQEVNGEVMQDVIALSKYQVEARIQVSPVIGENQLAMVEQLIRRYLKPGITLSRRDLQRKMNANRYGIQNFRKALENLEAVGEISSESYGKTMLYTRIEDPDEPDADDGASSVIAQADDRAAM